MAKRIQVFYTLVPHPVNPYQSMLVIFRLLTG